MTLWLTIIAIGIITFSLRLSFIALVDRWTMPDWLVRGLRYVPVAVLTAIIVPDLLLKEGTLHLALDNSRMMAGLVAGLVAWRTGNILLTIAAGMLTFIVFQMALS